MASFGIIRFKKNLIDRRQKIKDDPKSIIYLLVFIFTLHLTPASFVDSIFLEQFTGSDYIGYVFSLGSLFTIIGIVWARRSMQFFGNYRTFMSAMTLNMISLAFLSLSLIVNVNAVWGFFFIMIYILGFVCRTIAFLNIDVFLEHYSKDADTGGIRGLFLTILNIAFLLGPLIASFLVHDTTDAARVYVWGFVLGLLVIYLAKKYFKSFVDSKYEKSQIIQTIKLVRTKPNLRNIFMANLILRFFYAFMVIYTPIFLYDFIGFSLSQVTLIIAIALIPFVILQIPMGYLADHVIGEKEMLTAGFIIAAISTAIMSVTISESFIVWAGILFFGRIGASAIESMAETYLFKKIADDDINILGLYRVVRPIAYIVSPIIASLILVFYELPVLYIFLTVVLLFGIKYSLGIKDTL